MIGGQERLANGNIYKRQIRQVGLDQLKRLVAVDGFDRRKVLREGANPGMFSMRLSRCHGQRVLHRDLQKIALQPKEGNATIAARKE
jgi:hypothetical protein